MRESDSNRLYLGHLPPTATEDDVLKYLADFGTVTHIRIFPGYGWVTLSSSKDAKDVVDIFSRRRFMDADVNVEYAKPYKGGNAGNDLRSMSPPPVRDRREHETKQEKYPVIVDNLHPRTAWQELKDFGRMAGGTVTYCTLDKHRRGRGWIEYLTQQDAELSVRKLDGMILKGNTVSVVVHVPSRPDRVSKFSRERSRSPVRPMRSYSDKDRNWDTQTRDRIRSNSNLGPPRATVPTGPSYNQQHSSDRFKPRGDEWSMPRTSAYSTGNHDRTKSQGDEWGGRPTFSRPNYDNHSFRSSTYQREPSYTEPRRRDDRPAYNDRAQAAQWIAPKVEEPDRAPTASWSQPQYRNEERTSAVAIPPPAIKEERKPNEFFSSYESLAEMNRIAMEWLKAHSDAGPSNAAEHHT